MYLLNNLINNMHVSMYILCIFPHEVIFLQKRCYLLKYYLKILERLEHYYILKIHKKVNQKYFSSLIKPIVTA